MIPANRLQTVEEYYFSHKLREVRGLIAQGRPIINMGIGSPDLHPHDSIISAIQTAVTEPSAHQYQSYQGLPDLRLGIKKFYETHYNVSLNHDTEILPLMGSKEGIMHISMAFLNAGDQVLIPNPGYPTYTSVTNLLECKPVYYDLLAEKKWQPDFKALEMLDLSRVKLMWVSYPHMPTGERGSLALFEKLIAFARKHNILLVNDNPYSFVLNNEPLSILQIDGAKDVTLELNSLSKTYNMAGWRVGMVSGHAGFLDQILKVKSNMDSGMFYGIQKGAIAALELNKSWFASQNKIYERRRKLVFELTNKLELTYDKNAVGMFVWAKLPKHLTDAEAFVNDILYEKNLFITPGSIFGSNGNGYVRLSLCIDEIKIEEAIERF